MVATSTLFVLAMLEYLERECDKGAGISCTWHMRDFFGIKMILMQIVIFMLTLNNDKEYCET